MNISDKEMLALQNLADKQAGEDVDWISIADARSLTERGLARRTRSGWEITAEGLSLVQDQLPRPRLKLVVEGETGSGRSQAEAD